MAEREGDLGSASSLARDRLTLERSWSRSWSRGGSWPCPSLLLKGMGQPLYHTAVTLGEPPRSPDANPQHWPQRCWSLSGRSKAMPLHTGQRRAWLLHRPLTTAEITGSFQEWAVRGQGGTKQKVEPVSSVMGRSALSASPAQEGRKN